jgi:hypothetical protein
MCKATRSPTSAKATAVHGVLLAGVLTEALRAAAGFAQVKLPEDIKGVVAETLQSQRGAMCARSMAIKMALAMPTGIAVRETRLLAATGEKIWQDRTRTIRNAEPTGTTETADGARLEITVITKNTAAAIVAVTNIGTGATAIITTTGGMLGRGGR